MILESIKQYLEQRFISPVAAMLSTAHVNLRKINMAILNYTTTIEANKTVGEISTILAKAGACSVSTDFVNGEPVAIMFSVPIAQEIISFRLPSNSQGVYKALCRDKSIAKKYQTQEQAQRVAWRITKDWVEAQMAVIQSGLALLPEVFLPYAVGGNGQTLFEMVQKKGLRFLTGGSD